jgi:hypothetical protein
MNPVVEAWIVIEKLGALCATPGVDATVQEEANTIIFNLLRDVVKPGLSKLTATSAGIIVK